MNRQERLSNALRKADAQLGYAVEADSDYLAGAYLRGAVGMLILAVELQGEEIAALRESVHDRYSELDSRTIGLTTLGGSR